MSLFNIVQVENVCQRGSIRDGDVALLRQAIAPESALDEASIDDLFRIQALCHLQAPQWPEFFIECVTDYLIAEKDPAGYLTLDQVNYLLTRIERNGCLETKIEFDLILNLMDKARWAPSRLATIALTEIHQAVAAGAGVLRGGQECASGEMKRQDLALINQVLTAFGGDECMPLTRPEADILFAIDECVTATLPNETWNVMFAAIVANIMLAASGYRVPPRDVALATLQSSPDAENTSQSAILERIVSAYQRLTPEERAVGRLERQRIEIVTGERIEEPGALWLSQHLETRLGSSSALDDLIQCLQSLDVRLHPILQNIVRRHGQAA